MGFERDSDGAPGWQNMPGWDRVSRGLGTYHTGMKLLLCTLMKKVNGKQAANNPPGWGLYADMFKVCDDYNSSMGDVFWRIIAP